MQQTDGIVPTLKAYVGTVLQACKPRARLIASIMLVVQTVCWLAEGFGRAMMYGDGPLFVFAILTGKPWLMKWGDISVRGTVYVLAVLPTQLAGRLFHLSGYGLETVFGLFFFGVPLLATAWACALVWRRHPHYLLFPVIQFAFFGFLSFGFATEFIYASGFLWAAAFLVLEKKTLSPAFALAFVAGVFTHEMALPAAVVIACLAWRQTADSDVEAGRIRGRLWLGVLFATVAVAYVYMRLHGGGRGSDDNAISAINPLRVFKGPAFWYLVGWSLAALLAAVALKGRMRRSRVSLGLIGGVVAVAVILPVVLRHYDVPVNFGLGRYDAPRTLGGVCLFLLSLAFGLSLPGRTTLSVTTWRPMAVDPALYVCVCLAAAGAANLGTGIAFMRDLTLMVHAEQRQVNTARGDAVDSGATPETRLWAEMPARDAWIVNRYEEPWSRLYRSVILAKDYRPRHLVYAEVRYDTCDRLSQVGSGSILPAQTVSEVASVACRPIDLPVDNGKMARLGRFVHGLFTPNRLAASPTGRPAG